ncbi:MAG TPA: hypothetical protein VFL86_26935 [Burkholderiaceae bacterium]|nr:hypothetical protein [Burkholderiaceae bacterium]
MAHIVVLGAGIGGMPTELVEALVACEPALRRAQGERGVGH